MKKMVKKTLNFLHIELQQKLPHIPTNLKIITTMKNYVLATF
jgi:hypothetical protein